MDTSSANQWGVAEAAESQVLRALCAFSASHFRSPSANTRVPRQLQCTGADTTLDERSCTVDDSQPDLLVVPHTELSPDALRGVIESFVLREGTEYGEHDFSLDEKVAHVMRQLERGEIHVTFDASTETVDIIVARPARNRRESR